MEIYNFDILRERVGTMKKQKDKYAETNNLPIENPTDVGLPDIQKGGGDQLPLWKSVILTVAISVVATVTSNLIVLSLGSIKEIPEHLATIDGRLDVIDNRLDSVENNMASMKKEINGQIEKLEERVGALEKDVYTINGRLLASMSNSVATTYSADKSSYLLSAPAWKDSSNIIAVDVKSNKEYTASDLVDEKVLLTSTSSGTETIFYGQFNENNHWDGNCIINEYVNDKLTLIMDANYNDGTLLDYRQVFSYVTKKGDKVWLFSDRKVEGASQSGASWNYLYKDYEKSFDIDNASPQCVLSVESFEGLMKPSDLEAYYYGDTYDKYYNDDSGNAYLVKYADDGTVRTLYCGKFKNGDFEDSSGNAWYITREEDTDFMYYKGAFKGGYPKHSKGDGSVFENHLTPKRITELLEGKSFNCNLKWFGSEA